MDSPTAPPAARNGRTYPSPLETVKAAFRSADAEGFDAGLDALLACAHADCEFHPYGAPNGLRGHDEIRQYYRQIEAGGTMMTIRGTTFHEDGEDVIVDGALRVLRPGGSLAESQISWRYRFEDGLLREARGEIRSRRGDSNP